MSTHQETARLLAAVVRKQQRGEKRRKAIGKLVVAELFWIGMSLMSGLWFMLGVGIVHHEWIPACPTIGYWWAVIVAYLFRVSLTAISPTKAAT